MHTPLGRCHHFACQEDETHNIQVSPAEESMPATYLERELLPRSPGHEQSAAGSLSGCSEGGVCLGRLIRQQHVVALT